MKVNNEVVKSIAENVTEQAATVLIGHILSNTPSYDMDKILSTISIIVLWYKQNANKPSFIKELDDLSEEKVAIVIKDDFAGDPDPVEINSKCDIIIDNITQEVKINDVKVTRSGYFEPGKSHESYYAAKTADDVHTELAKYKYKYSTTIPFTADIWKYIVNILDC